MVWGKLLWLRQNGVQRKEQRVAREKKKKREDEEKEKDKTGSPGAFEQLGN